MLQQLGALRITLFSVVLLLVPFAFFTNAEPVGWGVLPAYVAPALAVILIFVLLLDTLMCRVFMSEQSDPQRQNFRAKIRVNLLGLLIIVLSWGPFFYALATFE